AATGCAAAADFPKATEADFVARDFRFASGETLPEVRIHYRTFGKIARDAKGRATNVVLIGHGTGGSGASLTEPPYGAVLFAGELFGPGQPLDAAKYFVVVPDGLGHGKSSKPSDGLHARFPRYGYRDMVEAQYRMLTEGLKVDHLRLVMGTSMGGMQAWMWGELHPDFMDALMPLASNPVPIAGRNRMWRKVSIDAIRNDPDFSGGDYIRQPEGLRVAIEMLLFMGSNSMIRQKTLPTRVQVDDYLDKTVSTQMANFDGNDLAYALDASWDYDPSADLGKIRAPLLAINSADDLINPPELGTLEAGVKRVPHGRSIVIPLSDETVGHGTHTKAILWKQYLVELLRQTE
ncbi:MAG TPA: alpha/beta fold hydrolase, partial [Usitatibacter sp.]|nr:alpha/beta fold hydrolase [Usitatibacter sp.]